jgi:hypothetical protein
VEKEDGFSRKSNPWFAAYPKGFKYPCRALSVRPAPAAAIERAARKTLAPDLRAREAGGYRKQPSITIFYKTPERILLIE